MAGLGIVWDRSLAASAVAGALLLVAGSDALAQGTGAAAGPPKVMVAKVVSETVPLDGVYTGTTQGVKSIELMAQVTGYLLERRFVEGTRVKTGDTLYQLDPRPFQAILDQQQAELAEQQATLEFANKEVARYTPLVARGNAPQERLDEAIELQGQTEADIQVSEAEINQAKINLEFTDIKAPFHGRVGRTLVNIGALVTENETALASLIQLDPIYVYFSPAETELPLIEDHQDEAPLKVTVTLPHASGETFQGELTFIDNSVDPQTATILMRATVSNPQLRLRAGQYVIVRLHISNEPDTLVVPAKAVSSIQGQRFVMVVGKDNKLERRTVTLGRQVGPQGFVVEDGLSEGEAVVVSDILTLRAGETVAPQPAPAS